MKYAVGIDPPKGFAIWNCTEKRFEVIKTMDFWSIIEHLDAITEGESDAHTIYIEAPQENAPVWFKGKGATGGAAFARVCQNVGENKATSKLLIEYCRRYDLKYETVRPTKDTWTKVDARLFRRLTNIGQRTSEHAREGRGYACF